MKRVIVLGGIVAALVSAAPAAAQTELSVTAGAFSSYVWRGLTLTSKPVLQPDISLAFPIGAASLTVGGWGNVELGKYDKAKDITEGGGTSFNFSEFDPYAELGFSAAKASFTLGGIAYVYPNKKGVAPLTSDNNTVEVYGTVGLDVPLSPSLAAYYDVDKVKGLYLEGSVSHGIPLGATTLNLGALAGWTGGQGCDPKGGVCTASGYNFYDTGLTHVDLSASVDLTAGALTISPVFHFQLSHDKWTKFKNAADKSDTKIWGGVSLSWGKSFGAKAEE